MHDKQLVTPTQQEGKNKTSPPWNSGLKNPQQKLIEK